MKASAGRILAPGPSAAARRGRPRGPV